MANATYPGISQITSCVGTRTLGVTPDVAVVTFLPQANYPALDGNLTWYENTAFVTWVNAHMDFVSVSASDKGGYLCYARIVDRRVWWKYTEIHGVYNERAPDGSIIEATEKSPQELAELLLQAIGETAYNVTALPDGDRPFISWAGHNAADELLRLCQERACDVSLNLDNSVEIVRLGVGASVPTTDVKSVSFGLDVGEVPSEVRVYTNKVLFQAKFKLTPVGYDVGSELKELKDLSYAPDDTSDFGGFETFDPDDEYLADSDDAEAKALANEWVYRLFKVTSFSDGSMDVPGYDSNPISSMTSVRLNRYIAEVYEDMNDEFQWKPAFVEGVFRPDSKVEALDNTEPGTRYEGGFRVFPETGLVLFTERVSKFADDDGLFDPGEIYLVASFSLRGETNQYVRHYVSRSLNGRGIYPIRRDELLRIVRAEYDPGDPTEVLSVADNEDQVSDAANAIIDAVLPEFQNSTATHVVYRGIIDGDTDGVNRQVGYSVGDKGSNTTVAQNSEPEIGVARRDERRAKSWAIAQQQLRIQASQQLDEFNSQRGTIE